jgi:hypothetical protein
MDVQSREQIKDRMIRLAAEHWNLEENEIEANFDPLVVLLFDAVAGEIESLGYRLKDIQSNLLNELAALMLPHSLLRAKPASCILTARPAEDTCFLKAETNFSTIAKTSGADEAAKETELNFTPIGEVKLLKVNLGYLRAGNRVYKYTDDGKKTIQYQESDSGNMIRQIHFTITGKSPILSLAGLQLFFDLKGHSEAGNFYFALQDATLSINHTDITLQKGFFKNNQYETSVRDAFTNDTDYSRKIQREIAGIYANQFLTINEQAEAIAHSPASPIILQNLPEKLAQEINGPHTAFCTLTLRRPFSIEIIERLQIAINAFPAINRKMERVFHKTEKWVNIIPLQLHGTYLDIHAIENINGTRYRLQNANYDSKVAEGQAIIRAARVSKSSSNDIRNALKSLLEAIRDESAYFSRTSNDFISSRLNEISKTLTRLEDQVQLSKDAKPTFRYVLLKSKNPGENVQISYWTTAPVEAAFVKANAAFKPVQHSLVEAGSCYSITPAVGGMEILNDYAQKQMLVRQLSSKGRVVSIEDIKLLCYEIFGQKLKEVRVQKTMKVLPGAYSGISRFIEIILSVANETYSEEERVYLVKQLSYQLELNGSFMFPFEITITEI